MLTNVSHISIVVKDQDKALDFYTNKLGFELHTDVPMETGRWLTVNPKGNKAFEIALMPAQSNSENIVGKQAGNYPLCVVTTDDCQKAYQELKSKGVAFIDEPKQEIWGVSCNFKDLYGNILHLNQPA